MAIKSVYFFIAEHVLYDDSILYLAEGLKELGIPFFSNKIFWKTDSENQNYLFNYDSNISYQDCDLIVISYTWFEYINHITYKHYQQDFPHFLFYKNRKYKIIYLDPTDGYKTRSWDKEFRMFDFVFRAKFNRNTYNPSNLRPWVLGFTNRIINATKGFSNVEDRDYVVLQNFNFSHPYEHGIRKFAKEKILPKIDEKIPVVTNITPNDVKLEGYDLLMWEQTGQKHSPLYYETLKKSFAIATFCGELVPFYPHNPSVYMIGGKKAQLKKTIYHALSLITNKDSRIIQWDSWRFWESLCAACIPININLEKYGVKLPVMPENWKHYVGLDLDNLHRDIERLGTDTQIKNIGLEGYKWAMKNYTPLISTKRLLEVVEDYRYPIKTNI